ncbi:hypothetical protein L6R29_17750 [Myxococcota bacterium]|nr:hypothetical protein [Myxococcota bacterium]
MKSDFFAPLQRWSKHLQARGILPPQAVRAIQHGEMPLLVATPEANPFEFQPPWCLQGQVRLSSASGGERLEKKVDFSAWHLGQFEFRLDLQRASDGRGYLDLTWKATEPSPNGWWLAFYLGEEVDDPICTLPLGREMEGQEILFVEQLHFDPLQSPFRVMVFSKDEDC